MILKNIQHKFHNQLDDIFDTNEVDSFFYLLVEHSLSLSRLDLALNSNLTINGLQEQYFSNALEKLKNQEPIQYIIGETEFFGLKFKVNEHTLIPRPETEELVQYIVDEYQTTKNQKLNILDIGTGTGCIAISLANKLKNAKVFALDVSKEALKVAKENSKANDVNVQFSEADILSICHSVLDAEFKYNVIVSNPPYIRYSEKKHMKFNVLNYEPDLALYINDENPLQFYKAIAEFTVNNLNNEGKLFFEINQYLGNETIHLLSQYGFSNIELKKDMFGNDRMIKCILNK